MRDNIIHQGVLNYAKGQKLAATSTSAQFTNPIGGRKAYLVADADCFVITGSGAQTADINGTSLPVYAKQPMQINVSQGTDNIAAIAVTTANVYVIPYI